MLEADMLKIMELLAVFSGLLYVILAAAGNRWCWLPGILSSVLYIIINLKAELYFDSVLQIYYVYAGIIGFFWWSRNPVNSGGLQSLGIGKLWLPIIFISLLSVISGKLLQNFLGTALSIPDALVTFFSVYATWLTARMVIQTWMLWIVIDITAAIMYWNKDLQASSFLYLIYAMAAVWGWYQWNKILKASKKT